MWSVVERNGAVKLLEAASRAGAGGVSDHIVAIYVVDAALPRSPFPLTTHPLNPTTPTPGTALNFKADIHTYPEP